MFIGGMTNKHVRAGPAHRDSFVLRFSLKAAVQTVLFSMKPLLRYLTLPPSLHTSRGLALSSSGSLPPAYPA